MASERSISPVKQLTGTSGRGAAAHHNQWIAVLGRLRRDPVAVVSAAVLLAILAASLLAPVLALQDPLAQDLLSRLKGFGSDDHLLGTDQFGRDVLSRLLWGGRNSLQVALVPAVLIFCAGTTIGLIAGYNGGLVDQILMRLVDILLAFPALLLAIAITAAFGRSMQNAMLALTVVSIPGFARIIRATTLVVREQPYVLSARSAGAGSLRLMLVHIFPNVFPIALVYVTLLVGNLIIAGAALSYLGLGVQPPEPDWGAMVFDGSKVLAQAPHLSLAAGTLIFLVTLAANLVGDALRDVLDPRLRGT
jgi:peptide/nickel transport system permease protein